MVNTFLIIFLNQKVGSILNLIRKVSLSSYLQHFKLQKRKEKLKRKKEKEKKDKHIQQKK
jgi:hypothetical protein